ncbi:MAG: N-acetylmuramoyl-L-alanine amidase [Clostridia bacterium]|nr:N-acetylmuramoyl-L-alanine amidase [Clostridia bacterium]
MKRSRRERTRYQRRQARRAALTAAALLAVVMFAVCAGRLGVFGRPVSAESISPTVSPTAIPTITPTAAPTAIPTIAPTAAPTAIPTAEPTAAPTAIPTITPTVEPSAAPVMPASTPVVRLITIEETERGVFSGVKIGIDPGHQLHGNSAQEPVAPGSAETKAKVSGGTQGVATLIPEYEVTLQVGLSLRDALEAQGAEVYMTREVNEIDISNIERAAMMNELGVDVVLRLHCNGATNQSITGIGLYVKPDGEGAEESYAISEYLIRAMGEATGADTEPIHVRDNYSGLNWSTVPSILVEMGYMSNPEEDRLLCSAAYQALLVDGMVKGLENYFTDHPVPAPAQTPAPTAAPAPESVGE